MISSYADGDGVAWADGNGRRHVWNSVWRAGKLLFVLAMATSALAVAKVDSGDCRESLAAMTPNQRTCCDGDFNDIGAEGMVSSEPLKRPTVVIRRMTAADISKIKKSEIQRDRYVVTYPNDYYQWYLEKFGKYCMIAEEAQNTENCAAAKIVGYILGKSEGNPFKGHVTAIAVHPGYRGRGYAKRMMNEFEETAKKEGCAFIDLFVDVQNDKALTFYKNLGYRIHRKVRDYYGEGKHAIDMHKALGSDAEKRKEAEGDDIDASQLIRWNVY
eukprot:jgi/Bigna1/144781/aug1.91_g19489